MSEALAGVARILDRAVGAIEGASVLDPVADAVVRVRGKVFVNETVNDLASGVPLGHPAHPLLVAVPIGAWTSALALDVVGAKRGARTLVGIGLLASVPTVVTGGNDWSYTSGAERRVGFVHLLVNSAAISAYAASWAARRRGRHAAGVSLAVIGAGFLAAGGWLGGHLAYALGVGVDTTAFQQIPEGWHDVAAEAEIASDAVVTADVGGVAVVVLRDRSGQVAAFADRCTHRGGPLHEGTVADGCLECPWHGSRFSATDGSVVRGPAVRPQPRLRVRLVGGRVEVASTPSDRSLRRNPVGHPVEH